MDQREGDVQPPLVPAGEILGLSVGDFPEPESRDQVLGLGFRRLPIHVIEAALKAKLRARRLLGVQLRVLQRDADQSSDFLGARRTRYPADRDRPRVRAGKHAQNSDQGRFSGAVDPKKSESAAGRHREIYLPQRLRAISVLSR